MADDGKANDEPAPVQEGYEHIKPPPQKDKATTAPLKEGYEHVKPPPPPRGDQSGGDSDGKE